MMRTLVLALIAGALAASSLTAPALADSRSAQESARKEMSAGNVMKLRDIERIVVPQIEKRGSNIQYLTPEFDEVSRAYRMKFIDNAKGQMIWVDVDARTGKILRISK